MRRPGDNDEKERNHRSGAIHLASAEMVSFDVDGFESSPNYDMIEQAKHRAAEPFGDVGDDNGRQYEPPPHDRAPMVSVSMLSHRRSPTAAGKPSFAYFKSRLSYP